MLSSIYRTLRGVEVTEENLGYDAICAAVLGEGHFLGAPDTLKSMEADYFYPKLSDREQPITWHEQGKTQAWDRANLAARAILDTHHPNNIPAQADREIRKAFNIL
jgi:trimethylamine--corrinoid protein Co-methyltransferase